MPRLHITHRTTYSYAQPVTFGEHRLMFRPRDSHDLRLLDTRLTLSPPGQVRWMHDVFGNSIAIVTLQQQASELLIESAIELEHFGISEMEFPIDPAAQTYPFQYPPEELPDLMPCIERRYIDGNDAVRAWLKQFYDNQPVDTQELLINITHAIKQQFTYRRRDEMGTLPPDETLASGGGTCRDYALLMIEALRTLGFAARFVSGYLYDAAADVAPNGLVGGAATHAWVQVYVPGAGWIEFDPTNGIIGGENLIRIAVARDPMQAIPVKGTFEGMTGAYLGMTVDVQVTRS
jgi:Transglutaminase-like enzymes, putative cysteine proteases